MFFISYDRFAFDGWSHYRGHEGGSRTERYIMKHSAGVFVSEEEALIDELAQVCVSLQINAVHGAMTQPGHQSGSEQS